jgi:hypothetical protein
LTTECVRGRDVVRIVGYIGESRRTVVPASRADPWPTTPLGIASPDETVRATAEWMMNAYVLDFLAAEHGATGRLAEERRT